MSKINKKNILLLAIFLMVGFLFFAKVSSAAYTYTPMERLPGFESSINFPDFATAFYKFGIWVVGICALLMVTVGGFMYLTSAGNTSKADIAKKIIMDAILGLIIALGSYFLLYVINPDLVSINISMKALGQAGTAITSTTQNTTSGKAATVSEYTGGGSCGGLATQSGIDKQCGDASPELSSFLACFKGKQSSAVISSISDSQGYTRCINNYQRPPCAHAQYSCHYGGRNCRGKGSYGVDFTTRNLSSAQLKAAANECGADFALDEGNHVHASVGKKAGCGCQ